MLPVYMVSSLATRGPSRALDRPPPHASPSVPLQEGIDISQIQWAQH